MKSSKIIIAGLAGIAIGVAIKYLIDKSNKDVDEIFFDSDFLPDTRKPEYMMSENPEMANWLKRPSSGEMNNGVNSIFT